MTENRQYRGIDCFRLIAAVLVIAVHTAPLSGISETADFILTRIAARVAVPFFFITTGFFLISRYHFGAEKLAVFLKKTAAVYAAAIVLYLPVNVYSGAFKVSPLLPNLLKDLVFDGTLYHLWYLPASMLGAALAWYLVTQKGYKKALTIGVLLYLIGLLGDSYYGFAEAVPVLHRFYSLIFEVTDQTRNGLFFAPLFLILGGFLADHRPKITARASAAAFAASFALMIAEGLTLRRFGLQRRDSMYIFLLPCMLFLFCTLLHFRGNRLRTLRSLSLTVYILHPMGIIAVRLAAKVLHLQHLLVENALVHFLAVSVLSAIGGIAAVKLFAKLHREKSPCGESTDRAYIELNLQNLEHNAEVLQKAMPERCALMAVIKAEAYGHGAYEIAAALNRMGVRSFAVATIDEAIALRKCGIEGEILILGYTSPERARQLRRYDLMQTVIDYGYAVQLGRQNCDVKVHIKIDTGMHRLGLDYRDAQGVSEVFGMKNLNVCGIFTHLCAADRLDEESETFTCRQIERFETLVQQLKARGIVIPKVHMQSSYGLLNYPQLQCDYVRAGIALYGVLSAPNEVTRLSLDLKPVLSLKSKVILLRKIERGETVGYSRAFTAQRDSVIAIVPIGYADGFPRNLSMGKGHVLICKQKVPVIGKICMDQLAVDVTDLPKVSVGATVTLIGRDGDAEIDASDAAQSAQSITNELLSRMGRRLKIITAR